MCEKCDQLKKEFAQKVKTQRFCGCGTVEDAIATADELFIEATASDCPTWAYQVATAFQAIALKHFMVMGIPNSEIIQIDAALGEAAIWLSKDTEVAFAAAKTKRDVLHH